MDTGFHFCWLRYQGAKWLDRRVSLFKFCEKPLNCFPTWWDPFASHLLRFRLFYILINTRYAAVVLPVMRLKVTTTPLKSRAVRTCLSNGGLRAKNVTFCKGGKKKKNPKNKQNVCDRDHTWPTKPKIFTIWLFTKSLPSPGLVGQPRFFPSSYFLCSVLSPHGPKVTATVSAIPGRLDNIQPRWERTGRKASQSPSNRLPLRSIGQDLVPCGAIAARYGGSWGPPFSGLGQEGGMLLMAVFF